MIRPHDHAHANDLSALLLQFSQNHYPLPGIQNPQARKTLVVQIIDSERRVKFVETLAVRPIDPARADPNSPIFDPLRAALLHMNAGRRDEAYWIVFLATHFSKHSIDGWGLMKAVYGKLGENPYWTWSEISGGTGKFRAWLKANQQLLARWRFGNHRKYESKRADTKRSLADVIDSYVNWVQPPKTHEQRFGELVNFANDPEVRFERLYVNMDGILSWGRLARFDHITMLGKLGLYNVMPGRSYLKGATGPRRGAALLLTGNAATKINPAAAEATLIALGTSLGVNQQIIEDSLCNWQKSPDLYVKFR